MDKERQAWLAYNAAQISFLAVPSQEGAANRLAAYTDWLRAMNINEDDVVRLQGILKESNATVLGEPEAKVAANRKRRLLRYVRF